LREGIEGTWHRTVTQKPDYNATASYFEGRAAKARNPAQRERFKQVAASYRAKAREQAEQRKGREPKTTDPKHGEQ
jgi:hypothetical protein